MLVFLIEASGHPIPPVILSSLTRRGELCPEMNRPVAVQMPRAPSFRLFSGERVGDRKGGWETAKEGGRPQRPVPRLREDLRISQRSTAAILVGNDRILRA